jgi:hypothetical protein
MRQRTPSRAGSHVRRIEPVMVQAELVDLGESWEELCALDAPQREHRLEPAASDERPGVVRHTMNRNLRPGTIASAPASRMPVRATGANDYVFLPSEIGFLRRVIPLFVAFALVILWWSAA